MNSRDDIIRPGDLCMIVKPTLCCGNDTVLGLTIIAEKTRVGLHATCICCKKRALITGTFVSYTGTDGRGKAAERTRLKKINPPEHGDSLPTRKDLEKTT